MANNTQRRCVAIIGLRKDLHVPPSQFENENPPTKTELHCRGFSQLTKAPMNSKIGNERVIEEFPRAIMKVPNVQNRPSVMVRQRVLRNDNQFCAATVASSSSFISSTFSKEPSPAVLVHSHKTGTCMTSKPQQNGVLQRALLSQPNVQQSKKVNNSTCATGKSIVNVTPEKRVGGPVLIQEKQCANSTVSFIFANKIQRLDSIRPMIQMTEVPGKVETSSTQSNTTLAAPLGSNPVNNYRKICVPYHKGEKLLYKTYYVPTARTTVPVLDADKRDLPDSSLKKEGTAANSNQKSHAPNSVTIVKPIRQTGNMPISRLRDVLIGSFKEPEPPTTTFGVGNSLSDPLYIDPSAELESQMDDQVGNNSDSNSYEDLLEKLQQSLKEVERHNSQRSPSLVPTAESSQPLEKLDAGPQNKKKDSTTPTLVSPDSSLNVTCDISTGIVKAIVQATNCNIQQTQKLYLKGDALKPVAQTILHNVFTFFETRKPDFEVEYDPVAFTSEVTGVAKETVHLMLKYKKQRDARKSQMYRKILETSQSNIVAESAIRRTVQQSFIMRTKSPSIKYIKNQCSRDGLVGLNDNQITSCLKKIGFETIQCKYKKICIEKPKIVAQRFHYLTEIDKYADHPIVYVLEKDIIKIRNEKQSVWRSWESNEDEIDLQDQDYTVMTIFFAASQKSFVDSSLLVVENEASSGSINNSKSWVQQNLLPSLGEGSVIVLGHERHDTKEETALRMNHGHSKEEIIKWLKNHGVTGFKRSQHKAILLHQADLTAQHQQICCLDLIIENAGYIPLHLPPAHKDLNPLELIWFNFEEELVKLNQVDTIDELRAFVSEYFKNISTTQLQRMFKQASKYEDIYRKNDEVMESVLDKTIEAMGGIVDTKVDSDSEDDFDLSDVKEQLRRKPTIPDTAEEPPQKKPKF